MMMATSRPQAVENTVKLIETDKVLALFNYVGTPTVTQVLPLLKLYSANNIYMFFPFTGAEPPRNPPYSDFVFNLRASYREEVEGMVKSFVSVGRKRIALFYQVDAYGRSGWEAARRALMAQGLEIVAEATYRRGTGLVRRQHEGASKHPGGSEAGCDHFRGILRRSGCFHPRCARPGTGSAHRERFVRWQQQLAEPPDPDGTTKRQGLHRQPGQHASGAELRRHLDPGGGRIPQDNATLRVRCSRCRRPSQARIPRV